MTQTHRGTRILATAVVVALHGAAIWWLAAPRDTARGRLEPVLMMDIAPLPSLKPAAESDAAEAEPAPETDTSRPATPQAPVEPQPMPAEMVQYTPVSVRAPLAPPADAGAPLAPAFMAGGAGTEASKGEGEGMATARKGESGGQPSADPYPAQVLAWIERHKRYPQRATIDRAEGVVVVALTLDRQGRVTRLTLVRSSGHPVLDDAALLQVRGAAPYPVAPQGARWTRRQFETPIVYRLKPARSDPAP